MIHVYAEVEKNIKNVVVKKALTNQYNGFRGAGFFYREPFVG